MNCFLCKLKWPRCKNDPQFSAASWLLIVEFVTSWLLIFSDAHYSERQDQLASVVCTKQTIGFYILHPRNSIRQTAIRISRITHSTDQPDLMNWQTDLILILGQLIFLEHLPASADWRDMVLDDRESCRLLNPLMPKRYFRTYMSYF